MLLKVVTEDRKVWSQWARKYRAAGNGIPLVYVVRADGKQLYGKSGAPQALPQFLAAALNSSGRIPSRIELARFSKDLKAAQEAVKAGDMETAARFVARNKTEGVFAEAAIALQKLETTMITQGKTALETAEKQLKEPKNQFEGLLALVAVERNYKRLRELSKPIADSMRNVRKDKSLRTLLAQAKLIDRAQQYEAEKNFKRALSTWQLVLKKYPDTPSAKRAAERIAAIEKQEAAPKGDSSKSPK